MIALLLDMAIKSTVILAAGFGVARALRRKSAAVRHTAWALGFAGLLLLPILSSVLPTWSIGWPALLRGGTSSTSLTRGSDSQEQAKPCPGRVESFHIGVDSQKGVVAETHAVAAEEAPAVLWPMLVVCDCAGGAFCGALLLGASIALLRVEREAKVVSDEAWGTLLQSVVRRYRLRGRVTLLRSANDATMPMTWGILRTRVLLPGDADAWPRERRRLVLLHELAHARRWDSLVQLMAGVACALYWWHPLAWLAKRRLCQEAEGACDDLVLRCDVAPACYADELLAVASTWRDGLPRASIAIARGNAVQLRARITALLDGERDRRGMSTTKAVAAVVMAAALLGALAVVHAGETASPADAVSPTVAGAAADKEFPKVVHFAQGDAQFFAGDDIVITEVRGTAETMAVGNVYQIKGRYTLASAKQAMLAAYLTAAEAKDGFGPSDRRQTITVNAGTGEFVLRLPVTIRGYPHVSFLREGRALAGCILERGSRF